MDFCLNIRLFVVKKGVFHLAVSSVVIGTSDATRCNKCMMYDGHLVYLVYHMY